MKDAEFEQARELSTVSEYSSTTVHAAGSTADYQQRVRKQCRSLPVLLFMVVNSTSLSAALNQSHRPWPLQKLR